MALYNEILTSRYAALLNKLFGVRSGSSPAPTLASDVMPVFSVDDPSAVELQWLRDVRSYGVTQTTGGGVGVPHFRIRNPAGSGLLAVIDQLQLSGYGSANVITRFALFPGTTTDLGGSQINCTALDSRQANNVGTGALLSASVISQVATEAAVALAPFAWQVSHVATPVNEFGPLRVPLSFILAPGGSLDIWSTGITTALCVAGRLRERALAERELSV